MVGFILLSGQQNLLIAFLYLEFSTILVRTVMPRFGMVIIANIYWVWKMGLGPIKKGISQRQTMRDHSRYVFGYWTCVLELAWLNCVRFQTENSERIEFFTHGVTTGTVHNTQQSWQFCTCTVRVYKAKAYLLIMTFMHVLSHSESCFPIQFQFQCFESL